MASFVLQVSSTLHSSLQHAWPLQHLALDLQVQPAAGRMQMRGEEFARSGQIARVLATTLWHTAHRRQERRDRI